METAPLLIFDVNETLLDIEVLAPQFTALFGQAAVLRQWFAELVLYSEALTLNGLYRPFGEIGAEVLRMLAAARGRDIAPQELRRLSAAMASLPAHPEVADALQGLKRAQFQLAAFTNNPRATAEAQLDGAGLGELFEQVFSVDDGARCYKPAPQAYRAVQSALSKAPGQLMMIACHPWDCLGAASLGWQTALIRRPLTAPVELGPRPDYIAADLSELAGRLMARYRAPQGPGAGPER